MRVHLEIGELVLEGFEYHDHKRIASAMERELARLISEQGLANLRRVENPSGDISAPSFKVPSNRNPGTIGREIARSIYRGIRS